MGLVHFCRGSLFLNGGWDIGWEDGRLGFIGFWEDQGLELGTPFQGILFAGLVLNGRPKGHQTCLKVLPFKDNPKVSFWLYLFFSPKKRRGTKRSIPAGIFIFHLLGTCQSRETPSFLLNWVSFEIA